MVLNFEVLLNLLRISMVAAIRWRGVGSFQQFLTLEALDPARELL